MKNTYTISILLLIVLLSSCQKVEDTTLSSTGDSDGISVQENDTFEGQSGEEGGWNGEDGSVESFRN